MTATFTRVVTFRGAGKLLVPPHFERAASFGGGAVFTSDLANGPMGPHFIADGNLVVVGQPAIAGEMVLAVLDEVIPQAPTALTIAIFEGQPEAALSIRIDGTEVWTGTTDTEGGLAPTSINVSEELGAAGSHTVTAIQDGDSASATFTLLRDPVMAATVMGPDARPIFIPSSRIANGTIRWVFQDLLPGGLGSWVMPSNPTEMSSPYREKKLNAKSTTSGARQHVTEGARVPVEWTFSGMAPDEETAAKLEAYAALNRRLYLIDHHGRAFKVVIVGLELVPRLRKTYNGEEIDGHDYTMTALVLDQDWIELVVETDPTPGGGTDPGGGGGTDPGDPGSTWPPPVVDGGAPSSSATQTVYGGTPGSYPNRTLYGGTPGTVPTIPAPTTVDGGGPGDAATQVISGGTPSSAPTRTIYGGTPGTEPATPWPPATVEGGAPGEAATATVYGGTPSSVATRTLSGGSPTPETWPPALVTGGDPGDAATGTLYGGTPSSTATQTLDGGPA